MTKSLEHELKNILTEVRAINEATTEATRGEDNLKKSAMLAKAAELKQAIELAETENGLRSFMSSSTTPSHSSIATSTALSTDEIGIEALRARAKGHDWTPEQAQVMASYRAMDTNNTSAAVPAQYNPQIIKRLSYFGPWFDVADVISTSDGALLNQPYSDQVAKRGTWLAAEGTTVGNQSFSFSLVPLSAHTITSNAILVSNELLQDSAFDLGGYIAQEVGSALGRSLNDAFTTGTGTGMPTGCFNGLANSITAANATVTFNDLIQLTHKIDLAYRPEASFMMNDNSVMALSTIKDGQGRYVLDLSRPITDLSIRGYKIWTNNSMNDVGAVGGHAIGFGAWNRYKIRRVKSIQLFTLRELYATANQTGFVAFGRFDGKLTDVNAIATLN